MLSPKQRADMLREYKAGKSSGYLARKYGVSQSYPRTVARRSGFKRDYGWHDDVRKAVARGARISTLARKYDRTPQRIWQIARAA